MNVEICIECDDPTGNAGKCEDSLYIGENGPYCADCFQYCSMVADHNAERARLEAEIARRRAAEDGFGEIIADLAGQIKSHEAHTWQQERAATVAWLGSSKDLHPVIIKLLDYVMDCIEKGEHWPPEEGTR